MLFGWPFYAEWSFGRRIRTSWGEFKMVFWRVRCSKCGKTFAPLEKFIGLGHYQTKSNELEKLVIEAVSGNELPQSRQGFGT